MDYTKGERILYCGEESWLVLIKNKPNRPDILVGSFARKEDAVLDQSAPDMYEALKLISEYGRKYPSNTPHLEKVNKALAKAEQSML